MIVNIIIYAIFSLTKIRPWLKEKINLMFLPFSPKQNMFMFLSASNAGDSLLETPQCLLVYSLTSWPWPPGPGVCGCRQDVVELYLEGGRPLWPKDTWVFPIIRPMAARSGQPRGLGFQDTYYSMIRCVWMCGARSEKWVVLISVSEWGLSFSV